MWRTGGLRGWLERKNPRCAAGFSAAPSVSRQCVGSRHDSASGMGSDYQRSVQEVVDALGSDASRGLTSAEARARLARDGPNQLATERPVPAWQKVPRAVPRRARHPAADRDGDFGGALGVRTRHPAAVRSDRDQRRRAAERVIGYVQQERAESAIAALRQMAAAHAHVIRDGAATSVPATEVVPGDILVVEEGDTFRPTRASSSPPRCSRPKRR